MTFYFLIVLPASGEFVIENDILFFRANTIIKKTLDIPISYKNENSKILFDKIENIKGRLVYSQIYLDYLNIDNKNDFINLIIDKK